MESENRMSEEDTCAPMIVAVLNSNLSHETKVGLLERLGVVWLDELDGPTEEERIDGWVEDVKRIG
jgi:hypothetical protein